MAKNLLFEFEVEMADGRTYEVVADQRDIARWEVQPFGCGFAEYAARGMAFIRFLAWSASVRQQLTTDPWDAWTDQCLEVTSLEEIRGSALPDDAGDPGRPAPSGEPSSHLREHQVLG